jgi:hypothetical protein
LAVRDARIMQDDPTRVVLTTDAQQPVVYQLTVRTSATAVMTAALTGSSNPEPQLQTAIDLNNNQVLLTFDQPVGGGNQNRATASSCSADRRRTSGSCGSSADRCPPMGLR